jgi:dipeptidyl-peptidase 4
MARARARRVVQQLNRLQNTNRLFVVNPDTGAARELLSETDPAWVDVFTRHRWIGDGERFPWLSERDGWQRLYAVNTENGRAKELFDEELDVMDLLQFVPESGDLYFIASPDNATQAYLYRTSIKGGTPRRITPSDQPGTHRYNISPDGKWALHTRSTFASPPVIRTGHPARPCGRACARGQPGTQGQACKLALPPVEFFQDTGRPDLEVDGYCLNRRISIRKRSIRSSFTSMANPPDKRCWIDGRARAVSGVGSWRRKDSWS